MRGPLTPCPRCVACREALQTFSPRQLRLMMLLSPWERRMAYGEQSRDEARARESQLRNFFANVDVALRRGGPEAGPQRWGPDEAALHSALSAAQAAVHARLLDSIDTRGAMDALGDVVKAVNLYLGTRKNGAAPGSGDEPRDNCGKGPGPNVGPL